MPEWLPYSDAIASAPAGLSQLQTHTCELTTPPDPFKPAAFKCPTCGSSFSWMAAERVEDSGATNGFHGLFKRSWNRDYTVKGWWLCQTRTYLAELTK